MFSYRNHIAHLRLFGFLISIFTLVLSCSTGTVQNAGSSTSRSQSIKNYTLNTPALDQIYSLTDSIRINIRGVKELPVDSLIIFVDGHIKHIEYESPLHFYCSNLTPKVGRQNLRMKIYFSDSLSQTLTSRIILLSDSEPKELDFKLVRRLPHNPRNYTQGLFYYKGFLYEGTGGKRQSRLIKTNLETHTVLLEHHLNDDLFGEGITRVGDKLFQLTYQQQIGFVYDIKNFELIREFNLQIKEGWGLTYDEVNLIMSDGSENLYFFDPVYLSLNKKVQVANHKMIIDSLNELEYVNGYVWANLYTTTSNTIIKVDPSTGKVLGTLDLNALFPKDIPRDFEHVLNGIAHNPNTNTFLITGKFWPVMYEIKIN